MDTLLNEIRDGIDYLHLQGKQINKIKMNAKLFENMSKRNEIEATNDEMTVFGITAEADENIETFAFIIEQVTS